MSRQLHFELRADSLSGEEDTVSVEVIWFKGNGNQVNLGTFTSDPATASGDAPWSTFDVDVSDDVPAVVGRLEIAKIEGADNAHIRNLWITNLSVPDYGQYPRGFSYLPDVEDGVFESAVILNDGGSSGQEYFAEIGEPITPSDYNYEIVFGTHAGSRVDEIDDWNSTGARWLCSGDGAYQSGREDQGIPTLTISGRNIYTALRPDGFSGAPHHNIDMFCGTAGSRGMSNIGPIWGWNSWSDFWFMVSGGHGTPAAGVYQVSGGSPSLIAPLNNYGFGFGAHVRHNFLTGELHAWLVDGIFGTINEYAGIHPHSVGAGHAGWLADQQDSSLGFWDTTIAGVWSNIFEPGHIAHKLQFSMDTLSVVEQDPLVWYFGPEISPPLRQRQRDDGLTVDAQQQKGYGSSQQSSLRRGGRVYY